MQLLSPADHVSPNVTITVVHVPILRELSPFLREADFRGIDNTNRHDSYRVALRKAQMGDFGVHTDSINNKSTVVLDISPCH